MEEPVTSPKSNQGISKPFEALDKASRRFLVTTRDITVETQTGNPFEDLRLTIYDQPCWRGFHGSSLFGEMLQLAAITVQSPDAVVPFGDYQQLYVRNLMATLRGYPLWSPTIFPQLDLPIEMSRKGIIVGDVGLVRSPGSFAVFFNIFQSADHPLNKGRVPDNFVPFRLNSSKCVAKRVFQDDAYIASPSVRVAHKEHSDNEDCSTVCFEANGPEGVILGLPCGATSEDLIDMPGLRQYAADNIFSWYVYLRKVIKWQCDNGDLRIVIGTDKSTAWSQAMFVSPDSISKDSFRIKLTTNKTGEGVTSNYECSGTSYHVTAGPPSDFLEEIRDEDDTSSDYCSQTLFIRTLNPMLSDHYWKACQTSDKPPPAITALARRNLIRAVSQVPFFPRLMDWTRDASVALRMLWPPKKDPKRDVVVTGWLAPQVQPDHPSNVLNRKLLDQRPNSKLVMTDDHDWLSCATDDDKFDSNTLTHIADRVLNTCTVSEDKEMKFVSIRNSATFS